MIKKRRQNHSEIKKNKNLGFRAIPSSFKTFVRLYGCYQWKKTTGISTGKDAFFKIIFLSILMFDCYNYFIFSLTGYSTGKLSNKTSFWANLRYLLNRTLVGRIDTLTISAVIFKGP